MARGRGIRPWLWLTVGVLVIPVGLFMALDALTSLSDPEDLSRVEHCRSDYADNCITERSAVVVREGYVRPSRRLAEDRWLLDVQGAVPYREPGELVDVEVPRQQNRDQVRAGLEVTAVFYEKRLAALRMSNGTRVQTDDHPGRRGTVIGYLGLFTLGGAAFAISTAVRTGRRQGFWRRTSGADVRPGPVLAVFLAGMGGSMLALLAGGSPWPAMAGAVAGAALGVWAWIRGRGRG